MRKYLAELHNKPDHHKRRFAFLASSTVTLFIFAIWSMATFGFNTSILGGNESQTASIASAKIEEEVSPFQSIRMNIADSLDAIKNGWGELKEGLEAVDLETEYQEMREDALDVYGQ